MVAVEAGKAGKGTRFALVSPVCVTVSSLWTRYLSPFELSFFGEVFPACKCQCDSACFLPSAELQYLFLPLESITLCNRHVLIRGH